MNERLLEMVTDPASLPTPDHLREVVAREGIDAATSLLYRSVLASPSHGPFIHRIEEILQQGQPARLQPRATLVIVPGAFYREHPHTGADGRFLRELAGQLGFRTDRIPLLSLGSLQQNAKIICDWLSARQKEPVILASLSKGGSDVKMAMAEPNAAHAFARVKGWINLCGILDGTPMAEWLLSWNPAAVLNRLYYRMRGRSLQFVRDLRRGRGCPLDFKLPLPAHVRMVSVVGFPLGQHLSNGIARRCHRRLAAIGPNDGGLVLSDVCALPGLVYPIWGADHYLRPTQDVRGLVAAILQYLTEEQ